jgi:hypothetical protein
VPNNVGSIVMGVLFINYRRLGEDIFGPGVLLISVT